MARRAKSVGSCWKVHEAFSASSPVSRCHSCSKAARSCRLEMRSATDVPFARSGEKRASEGDAPGRPIGLDPTHPGLGCLAPERYGRPAPGARAPTALCPSELPLKRQIPGPEPGSDRAWDGPPLAFSPYIGRCSLHGAGPGGLQRTPDSGPVGPELRLVVSLDAQAPAHGVQLQHFLFPAVPCSGPASTPGEPSTFSCTPPSGPISWVAP